MMLVEAEPVIAEAIDLLPGVEVFRIGAHRDFGFEMLRGQRIRQFVADLQMVELLAIRQ